MNPISIDPANVESSLNAANTALLALPAPQSQEWILPPGTFHIANPLLLGKTGYSLKLTAPGCGLSLDNGGLILKGDTIAVNGLSVAATTAAGDCTAVTVEALDECTIDDLTVEKVTAIGAVVGVSLQAQSVRVTGLTVGTGEGVGAQGVTVIGDQVQLADVEIETLDGGTGDARGVVVSALVRLDAADLRISNLTGKNVLGAQLVAAHASDEALAVVDVDATNLTAAAGGSALGILCATAGALRLRGFTVSQIAGDRANGVVALAGEGGEVSTGRVDHILGNLLSAGGVRVIATPSLQTVAVRDIAVEAVSGKTAVAGAPTDPQSGWHDWGLTNVSSLAGAVGDEPLTVTDNASDGDVVGLFVGAFIDEMEPLLDQGDAGALTVEDHLVHLVGGMPIQIDGGLRPTRVRRIEIWSAYNGGWIGAQELQVSELTLLRCALGLGIGPGGVQIYDSIFARIGSGSPFVVKPGLIIDPDAELLTAQALFADSTDSPYTNLGPLPFTDPGNTSPWPGPPDGFTPLQTVDLTLAASSDLNGSSTDPARRPVAVPADEEAPFIGAHAPALTLPCGLIDPEPHPFPPPPATPTPDPVVNYLSRDAKSLLAVMQTRALDVLQPWSTDLQGAADFTTMVMEAIAERLDHLSYEQERAVAEGFLTDAALRRSVEDHARALDYTVDDGLSATTMIRFTIDLTVASQILQNEVPPVDPGSDPLSKLTGGSQLVFPAATLIGNSSPEEHSIIFATEESLAFLPRLDTLKLSENIAVGATSARFVGNLPELTTGRWLLLYRGRGQRGLVVKATVVEVDTDTTLVYWDPRRPAQDAFLAADDPNSDEKAAIIYGNVVPAHHGLPLSPGADTPSEPIGVPEETDSGESEEAAIEQESFARMLKPWQELLTTTLDGSVERELTIPVNPLSVQAAGYPLPGQEQTRTGQYVITVAVAGEEWTRTDDLSLAGPTDQVYAVRAGLGTESVLRFGDGVNGQALPEHEVEIEISMRAGVGLLGNIGEGVLTRLLYFPKSASDSPNDQVFSQTMEVLRTLVLVSNPLPAVGGREPEDIERIRYRAPFGVSEMLSAVTPDDYVRLIELMPEVAGATASLLDEGIRSVVRVVVLLRDEDTLDPNERLRRWALVRGNLEDMRLMGFDVEAVPPIWVPLDLDITVNAQPYTYADELKDLVVNAIAGQGGFLDPDSTGLGGDVELAALYQAVLRVPGVAGLTVKRFRRLEPHAPDHITDGIIPIEADEVAVVNGPQRPDADGILTVTVCGGLR